VVKGVRRATRLHFLAEDKIRIVLEGLRKAAARRFVEARCSNQQIKAWTGHTTDSEIARDTAAVDQQRMSDATAEMLLANLIQQVSQKSSQAPEKG